MPAVTRSMTKILFSEDTTKAPFKIDVLTTPGIASNIAKHLGNNHGDLKSMFLLINNNRYRHELMPYCDNIKQQYYEHLLEVERKQKIVFMRRQQRELESKKKKEMIDTIESYLQIHHLTEGDEYTKLSIFASYEYLYEIRDHLHLLGSKFASTVYQNFYQIVNDLENDVESTNKLFELEYKLEDYLETGFNAYYDQEYYNEYQNELISYWDDNLEAEFNAYWNSY